MTRTNQYDNTRPMQKECTRLLLHLGQGLRRAVDPAEVYYLEAQGNTTLVRLLSPRTLCDRRSLGELMLLFKPHGFLRIHRSWAVNPAYVLEIRKREGTNFWELSFEPSIDTVLPISRACLESVWQIFGEKCGFRA